MDNGLPDELSNQQLDSFLGDLSHGLAAHLDHMLGVTFHLRFPALEGTPDAAFDPSAPCRFEECLAAASRPTIAASAPFRELADRHRGLHEFAADCLAKSTAGALQPTELADFLRAVHEFLELAD